MSALAPTKITETPVWFVMVLTLIAATGPRSVAGDDTRYRGLTISQSITLLRESTRDGRVQACLALKEAGRKAKSAVPDLILAMKDKEASVRQYAADALGAIGPDAKESIPMLRGALKDGGPFVVVSAAT